MATSGEASVHLVDGQYGIADLVDLDQLEQLFEQFSAATGFTIGFLDHPGMEVLIATGWRDICTRYHRECPAALENCLRSNRHLLDQLDEPGKLVTELCDNGLVDCATPIIIEGRHIASLATGQVLLEPPDLERFRRQAREFGLDEEPYLAALDEIPVIDEQRLRVGTAFLGEMARVISEVGYARAVREREVAERLRTEALLRESEARYRALFQGAAEGILVADRETRVLQFANPSACELFGYERAELEGMAIDDLHPAEVAPRVVANFEMHSVGEQRLTPELPCRRKDGGVFHADVVARSAVIAGREVAVGFFTDVSARMAADEERQRLQRQLVLAQRMEAIGRLAGGVAHDFNNLLSVILGFTDLAMSKTRPVDPLREDLQQIVQAGERAAELTRQLLAFSRKQDLRLRALDLAEVVAGMETILRRTIGEDVELACALAPGLGTVKADRSQLEQVIMNLALNARDAMPDGGQLAIAARNRRVDDACSEQIGELAPGEYVQLTISDTGCGMDEATRVQVFEPFFTTKEPGKGTGLGLSMVYGTIRQGGGAIRVYSEPAEGTTFRIYLPRVDAEVDRDDGPPVREPPAPGTETVVVVEDDDGVRNLASRILTNAGYDVHAADGGEQALAICEQLGGRVRLLLTDVVMPRMSGSAVAERLGQLCPDLRVLFMSGYTYDILGSHGVLRDGTRFIAKPFNATELTRCVREVLDEVLDEVPGEIPGAVVDGD